MCFQLFHGITAKLFQHCICQDKREHRFCHNGSSRYGSGVRSLLMSQLIFFSLYIHRALRFDECGYGFHHRPDDNGLSIAHAPFNSTSIIGVADIFFAIPTDFIMNFTASLPCFIKTHTNFNSLKCIYRHDGFCDPGVEFLIPLGMGT